MRKVTNEDKIKISFDDLEYMVESVNIKKNLLRMSPSFNISPLLQGLHIASQALGKSMQKGSFLIIDEAPFLPQEIPKVEYFYENH
ncbi:g039 [Yersinia phage phiR1-37]|uniref:hypothetical protein n=1 Tax=Yersinia phage phiR1-37 TaxID=331278 RepID=UPI00022DBCD3|nr:hypothetical protein phiR1-37_gp039 [Yersinia phage phiR1-37]CCE26063.1 g039 [Yersinia phage phiR1-37]